MKTMRKGYGKGLGMGYKNLMPMDSHIHSLSAKGIKSKVTTLNMMGLATMKRLNEDASRKAKNLAIEPFEITSKKDMEKMPPFPFPYIGEDYTPRGWKKVNEYFVDSSGFGADDEMALSIRQFISKIEVGKGYAITSAGQFQVYVSEFEKVSSKQLKRLNAKVTHYPKLTKRQQQLYDKLVKSGASELFAGYVLKYPDSHIASDFLQGYSGGGFSQALWKGDVIDALFRADLDNTRKLNKLLGGDKDGDFRSVFANVPAFLKKEKK